MSPHFVPPLRHGRGLRSKLGPPVDRTGGLPSDAFFPELRALRILLYRSGNLPLLIGSWATAAAGFLWLMTFKSLQPLTAYDVAVALTVGGLLPLSLMIRASARQRGRACGLAVRRDTSVAPASALAVLAALASCMCCLPIIPLALGTVFAGTALASQVLPITVALQTWSTELDAAAVVLLVWSLDRGSRALIRAADAS